MKTRVLVLFLGAMALLAAGCSTITSRIKEKSSVFATLDPHTQEMIRHGRVEVGYTADMVYMALGSPDERMDKTTAHGRRMTWIYTTTYTEYAGTAHVGYRRVFVRDPHSGRTAVLLEPVYSDVYQDRTQENIRILFEDDKVSAIEQVK